MSERDRFSTADKFDPKALAQMIATVGHGGALGVSYEAHGEDWVQLGLAYSEKLVGLTRSGILASGPIISLMDMAASMAIWVKLGRFRNQATLDLRVDYLRPATPGRDIHGRGECYRITRSIAFVRGMAHDGDEDDPVAHVTGTFMFTKS